MISIAIYSDSKKDICQLKEIIQDFLIENKVMAKISIFDNEYKLITVPDSYDIYIMDMDFKVDVLSLGKQMMNIDHNGHFIYTSNDTSNAYLAAKIKANYFLAKPIEKEELIEILIKIKKQIQEDSIIIKTALGERRIRVNQLNYINIVKRCLCYHLTDGTMFDGKALRSSFEKAINPLHKHKAFLFLAPSLLINLGEIKIINSDNIVFENEEILFIPKKSYEMIREAWINHNRFLNLE